MNKMNETRNANESGTSFCSACLSSNRNLTSITDLEEYIDIFVYVSNNALKVSQEVYLCWECVAILKKIKLFKYRIQSAQRILSYNIYLQNSTLKCLSRLSIANQVAPTIKQEITHSDDDHFDHIDHNNTASNDHGVNEIKKENKPKTSNKRQKVSHYRIVYGPNVYKKSLLRKKFSIQPEEVSMWLESERDSKYYKSFKFKCDKCVHGFKCEEELVKHNLEYHDKSLGSHVCPTCDARFATARLARTHVGAHVHAHECLQCGYRCYSARRLNAHIDTHRSVQCKHCHINLPDVGLFNEHYRAVHRVFLCDHCGQRCRTKYLLEKHMSRHYTIYRCSPCSRQYKTRAALHKHRATRHTSAAPDLAYCVHCDKQFDSVFVYRRHVLNTNAHAREHDKLSKKSQCCPECGKTYTRRAYMMNHYRHVHTKQSKHYCTHCDKHFLNRTRYVDHMRFNHEGIKREKNKLCYVCGRGFATNRTLENHVRTHSGERPYQCEYCAAKFAQKHSLVTHVASVHLNTALLTRNHASARQVSKQNMS